MSESTAARPTTEQSCHWYHRDGRACYEVPRASGDGMRPTTLADARKLDLLPSVTTILGVLHKEALVQWRVEQAVLACLTSPKRNDEPLDDFTRRILHTEKVQDQESDVAKRRGTEIHAGLESMFKGDEVDESLLPWINPAFEAIRALCPVTVATEQVLVGGVEYAGRCDFIGRDHDNWEWVLDFKSTKKLPAKESYWEHRCQTAAYLRCLTNGKRHANVYISTVDRGAFVIHDNGDYGHPYRAFMSLLNYWQIANNYTP